MQLENDESTMEAAMLAGFDEVETPEKAEKPEPVQVDEREESPAPTNEKTADETAELTPAQIRAEFLAYQERAEAQRAALEQRLRKSEGRLGDLNARIPVPPPPAPPRLEKVERVREELPEVVEALEEFWSHHNKPKDEPQQEAKSESVETPVLDEEFPDWPQTFTGQEFQGWLSSQPASYREKVNGTDSESVVLAAIAKFTKAQAAAERAAEVAAAKSAAASQANQVRQARVASAAAPHGAARKQQEPIDLNDAFTQGFKGT